jgi:hypothetical protein
MSTFQPELLIEETICTVSRTIVPSSTRSQPASRSLATEALTLGDVNYGDQVGPPSLPAISTGSRLPNQLDPRDHSVRSQSPHDGRAKPDHHCNSPFSNRQALC